MPRTARIKSTTGTYHVLLRAQKKRGIFRKEEDYVAFIRIMNEVQHTPDQAAPAFQVLAYCLMPGYVHMLVREGSDDIAAAMRRIMVHYAPYYNEQYNTSGRVFYDRFRSEPCDTPEYTQAVIGYIHNVPVKHGRSLTPAEYPWSSYRQLQDSTPMPTEEQILSVRLTEDRRRVFTDYMVAKHIKRLCSIDSIEQFADQDKKVRRTALAMMRKRGVSYGQLARVTGVTINVVRKARVFVKLPIRKG